MPNTSPSPNFGGTVPILSPHPLIKLTNCAMGLSRNQERIAQQQKQNLEGHQSIINPLHHCKHHGTPCCELRSHGLHPPHHDCKGDARVKNRLLKGCTLIGNLRRHNNNNHDNRNDVAFVEQQDFTDRDCFGCGKKDHHIRDCTKVPKEKKTRSLRKRRRNGQRSGQERIRMRLQKLA